MPRIPTAKTPGEYSGRGPSAAVTRHDTSAASQPGRELEKMGKVFDKIGGDFGNLALRMHATDINNEQSAALTDFSRHMAENAEKIGAVSPLEKSKVYGEVATAWKTNHKYKYDVSRDKVNQQLERHIFNEQSRLTIQGMTQVKNEAYRDLPDAMLTSIHEGNPGWFLDKLDFLDSNGMLYNDAEVSHLEASGQTVAEDRKVSGWAKQYGAAATTHMAFQMIAEIDTNSISMTDSEFKEYYNSTKKSVIEFIDSATSEDSVIKTDDGRQITVPALSTEEKLAITKKVTSRMGNLSQQVSKSHEAAQRGQVDKLFDEFESGKIIPTEIDDMDTIIRSKVEQQDWNAIILGMQTPPIPESDPDAVITAQDMLFDLYHGSSRVGGKVTGRYIKTDIALKFAKKGEKKISQEHFDEIKYYMKTPLNPVNMIALKTGWDVAKGLEDESTTIDGKEFTGANKWKGVWITDKFTKKEQIDAIKIRREIFDTLLEKQNRKKEVTPVDAVTISKSIEATHNVAYTKKLKDENSSEELRQKNTKEAYEKGIELGYWK